MRSEAQKAADKRYKSKIKAEKSHFCIEMSASEAKTLKILAEQAGTNPHAIMLGAARDFISAHTAQDDSRTEPETEAAD